MLPLGFEEHPLVPALPDRTLPSPQARILQAGDGIVEHHRVWTHRPLLRQAAELRSGNSPYLSIRDEPNRRVVEDSHTQPALLSSQHTDHRVDGAT